MKVKSFHAVRVAAKACATCLQVALSDPYSGPVLVRDFNPYFVAALPLQDAMSMHVHVHDGHAIHEMGRDTLRIIGYRTHRGDRVEVFDRV